MDWNTAAHDVSSSKHTFLVMHLIPTNLWFIFHLRCFLAFKSVTLIVLVPEFILSLHPGLFYLTLSLAFFLCSLCPYCFCGSCALVFYFSAKHFEMHFTLWKVPLNKWSQPSLSVLLLNQPLVHCTQRKANHLQMFLSVCSYLIKEVRTKTYKWENQVRDWGSVSHYRRKYLPPRQRFDCDINHISFFHVLILTVFPPSSVCRSFQRGGGPSVGHSEGISEPANWL